MNDQPDSNAAFLDGVTQRLTESESAYRAVIDALTPEQSTWSPDAATWSVTQIVDHLLVVDGAYLPRLARAIEKGRPPGGPAKHGMIGRMVLKMMNDDRKRVKAPRAFGPTRSDHDPRLAERFAEHQRALLERVEASRSVDLNTKFGTPISALLRFRLGEALDILATHQACHLRQIERLRAHAAFPA